MRFVKTDIVKDYAAAAGWTSDAQDVSKVEFFGVYVKVSAATDITLQVNTTDGFIDYDTISFSAAGSDFWNIWSLATDKIRFKTSAAVTITTQAQMKT